MATEAYILVGGRSSRFAGGEKPMATIGGKTLVENAVEIVRNALPDGEIFLVARGEHQLIEEAQRLGVGRIQDRVKDRGPLGGLFTALANSESEWLFLFACDLPLMSPTFIAELLTLCEPKYGAVVPRQADGRLQPLCTFYNVAEVLPVVEALIHRPDGAAAMLSVIDALDVRIVEPSAVSTDPGVWLNVNRVEDLASAAEIERKLSGGGEI